MAKAALGKGLGALISASSSVSGVSRLPALAQPAPGDVVNRVTLDQIVPSPLQPRKEFQPEMLTELMESIREHGIIQPLIVRRVNGKLELIAGERRFRASRELGLKEVPVIVREASDKDVLEMALIENLQRADLDLIEEAEGYRDLMQAAALTQEEVARRVGKARATVANALRLLDLSSAIKSALSAGTLSAGHAKVLLGVAAPDRDLLAARVIAQGLSVRALEKLVAGLDRTAPAKKKTDPAKTKPASDQSARQLKFLADRMQQELGTKVTLTPARVLPDGKRAMGQIVIEYFDNEDLSRLLDMLNLGDLA